MSYVLSNNYLSCLSLIYSNDDVNNYLMNTLHIGLDELVASYEYSSIYFTEYDGIGFFIPFSKGFIFYPSSNNKHIRIYVTNDNIDLLDYIDNFVPKVHVYEEGSFFVDYGDHKILRVDNTCSITELGTSSNPYVGMPAYDISIYNMDTHYDLFTDYFMISQSDILGIAFRLIPDAPEYVDEYISYFNEEVTTIAGLFNDILQLKIMDYSKFSADILSRMQDDGYLKDLDTDYRVRSRSGSTTRSISFYALAVIGIDVINKYLPDFDTLIEYWNNKAIDLPNLRYIGNNESNTTVPESINYYISANYAELPEFDPLEFGDDVFYKGRIASNHKNAMVSLVNRVRDIYNGYIGKLDTNYKWMFYDNAVVVVDNTHNTKMIISVYYYNNKYNNAAFKLILPLSGTNLTNFMIDYSSNILTIKYKYNGSYVLKMYNLRSESLYTPILSMMPTYVITSNKLDIDTVYYDRGIMLSTNKGSLVSTSTSLGSKLNRIIL